MSDNPAPFKPMKEITIRTECSPGRFVSVTKRFDGSFDLVAGNSHVGTGYIRLQKCEAEALLSSLRRIINGNELGSK